MRDGAFKTPIMCKANLGFAQPNEYLSFLLETYAMIAPILPKTEGLVAQLSGKVGYVLIDKMNYHYADRVYRRYNLEYAMTNNFFTRKKMELANALKKEGIPCQLIFWCDSSFPESCLTKQ